MQDHFTVLVAASSDNRSKIWSKNVEIIATGPDNVGPFMWKLETQVITAHFYFSEVELAEKLLCQADTGIQKKAVKLKEVSPCLGFILKAIQLSANL